MRERAEWDVAVVGGGPAGLAAASASAAAGARTVVLERAEHPRYKTCGGGLLGVSRAAVAGQITLPVRDEVSSATFTLRGGQEFSRSNAAIAARLFIAEKSVAKHAAGIFSRLGLALSDDDNRRVLAVLAYLNG